MATVALVRKLAMALPGAEEKDHFGRPSFRVGGKIFATLWPAEKRAVLKLPADHQTLLFEAQPDAFSPARWGSIVWTF
ncbi:MAG TPA: MmcQ/YjbR family DNA-binding protein, partial [Vineibacter sp.]|nr:MmcQ/YjbR family DNA-binding protein [Vineibacter sp.]